MRLHTNGTAPGAARTLFLQALATHRTLSAPEAGRRSPALGDRVVSDGRRVGDGARDEASPGGMHLLR